MFVFRTQPTSIRAQNLHWCESYNHSDKLKPGRKWESANSSNLRYELNTDKRNSEHLPLGANYFLNVKCCLIPEKYNTWFLNDYRSLSATVRFKIN